MEIRTILGRKPEKITVERKGKSTVKMPPQVVLETPIMFYGITLLVKLKWLLYQDIDMMERIDIFKQG